MDIDYRDLLKKYMAIVGDAEGVDFLGHVAATAGPYLITPQDLAALRGISAEVDQDTTKAGGAEGA